MPVNFFGICSLGTEVFVDKVGPTPRQLFTSDCLKSKKPRQRPDVMSYIWEAASDERHRFTVS